MNVKCDRFPIPTVLDEILNLYLYYIYSFNKFAIIIFAVFQSLSKLLNFDNKIKHI